jgi:hypothetical protein
VVEQRSALCVSGMESQLSEKKIARRKRDARSLNVASEVTREVVNVEEDVSRKKKIFFLKS